MGTVFDPLSGQLITVSDAVDFGDDFGGIYDVGTAYTVGQIVEGNGFLYICRQDNTGESLGDTNYWGQLQLAPAGVKGDPGIPGDAVETMFMEDRFFLDGSGDVTDLEVFLRDIPYDSYAIRVSAVVSEARTAGSISFQLRRNGSLVPSSALDLSIDGTNTVRGEVEIPHGDAQFFFADNQSISLTATSSGFAPGTCRVDVYVTISKD